jgi:hypothetical protein
MLKQKNQLLDILKNSTIKEQKNRYYFSAFFKNYIQIIFGRPCILSPTEIALYTDKISKLSKVFHLRQ